MAQRQSFQIGTGLFILLGFAALAYLATQTTSLANYSQGDSYAIKALHEHRPARCALR
jgi:phospholipid/cholesterol/gamma-HCH transport system substrate-binding protein